MADADRPQITLITPSVIDLATFPDRLARVLDTVDIACLRLTLASRDLAVIGRAADACRLVAHARDVAIVIESHVLLATAHGLDGVHLTDGARSIRAVRKDLGPDAIIGAYCGHTRHDGINAAEAGADYVAFGPIGASSLGDGLTAAFDLLAWWSEMIEVPVVAEGGLTRELVGRFGPVSDFFGIGDEIWSHEDPSLALRALIAAL